MSDLDYLIENFKAPLNNAFFPEIDNISLQKIDKLLSNAERPCDTVIKNLIQKIINGERSCYYFDVYSLLLKHKVPLALMEPRDLFEKNILKSDNELVMYLDYYDYVCKYFDNDDDLIAIMLLEPLLYLNYDCNNTKWNSLYLPKIMTQVLNTYIYETTGKRIVKRALDIPDLIFDKRPASNATWPQNVITRKIRKQYIGEPLQIMKASWPFLSNDDKVDDIENNIHPLEAIQKTNALIAKRFINKGCDINVNVGQHCRLIDYVTEMVNGPLFEILIKANCEIKGIPELLVLVAAYGHVYCKLYEQSNIIIDFSDTPFEMYKLLLKYHGHNGKINWQKINNNINYSTAGNPYRSNNLSIDKSIIQRFRDIELINLSPIDS